MIKILDCTLRDGGYYNNWGFSAQLIDKYLTNINFLPVEYAELGYRSLLASDSAGEFFNIPVATLERVAKLMPNVKKAVMIEEKNTPVSAVESLMHPCIGLVDMVRVAVSVDNIANGLTLVKCLKTMGFETSLNLLHTSEWKGDLRFIKTLHSWAKYIDFFYIVDSYGSLEPVDINHLVKALKRIPNIRIGFHGHNNLELALINSLTALDAGCEIIDSTVLGMGRGAGNLKTELLLTYLNRKAGLSVNYNSLTNLIEAFQVLHDEHHWGTNIAYMFSGSYAMHQNEVMNAIKSNEKTISSIIDRLIKVISNSNTGNLNPIPVFN